MTIGPRLPGVRDIALWTTDQLRDFADRTHALRMQAAPKAVPGEQNTVPAEWLEQAYREGWAACRDAETIGEEAEDWAFGNSTANSRMIDAQQAAPKQEVQEPHGWLYEWTHSSATGKPDSTYTAFTTDEAHARKHDNCRAIYTAPQPAPATQQAGDVVAYLDVGASGYLDLGAALSEDALQQLPKGRHALVIAGTYGIDGYVAAPQPSPTTKPAPQQEVQEPVTWESTTPGYIKYITQARYEKFSPAVRRWYKPYKCSNCSAPQPAPAPLSEQDVLGGLMATPNSVLENCADAFEAGVRFAEHAHGITQKGGQHGAE
jgi:hypothetical protein